MNLAGSIVVAGQLERVDQFVSCSVKGWQDCVSQVLDQAVAAQENLLDQIVCPIAA